MKVTKFFSYACRNYACSNKVIGTLFSSFFFRSLVPFDWSLPGRNCGCSNKKKIKLLLLALYSLAFSFGLSFILTLSVAEFASDIITFLRTLTNITKC